LIEEHERVMQDMRVSSDAEKSLVALLEQSRGPAPVNAHEAKKQAVELPRALSFIERNYLKEIVIKHPDRPEAERQVEAKEKNDDAKSYETSF